MAAFDEKRRFSRVPTSFPVKYKDMRKTGQEYRGSITKNVSEGGVRFRSDRFISLACRLIVELNLPALDRTVRAVSKIAWIKKLPVGDDYEIGNQFLEISREDKEAIRDFVSSDTEGASA